MKLNFVLNRLSLPILFINNLKYAAWIQFNKLISLDQIYSHCHRNITVKQTRKQLSPEDQFLCSVLKTNSYKHTDHFYSNYAMQK